MAIIGLSGLIWWFSSNTPWQDLAERYRTEKQPDTFIVDINHRTSFKRIPENRSGSLALTNLGIGVSDEVLYLSDSVFPFLDNFFFLLC